jgi:GNAT superfamily N-acetyltransferase
MIIRKAVPADAEAMAALQNRIIRIGGTTSYQVERAVGAVLDDYICGPTALSCFVADVGGQILGFQALGLWDGLPAGWGDIGTFVSPDAQAQGIGTALFAATRAVAPVQVINATIRADNRAGLRFYARLGFVDYADEPDFTLLDGQKVGRISRRFEV